MGKQIGTRRKGIKWEYNWDGVYYKERWNGYDRRYWRRWLRRENQRDLKERIQECRLAWDADCSRKAVVPGSTPGVGSICPSSVGSDAPVL